MEFTDVYFVWGEIGSPDVGLWIEEYEKEEMIVHLPPDRFYFMVIELACVLPGLVIIPRLFKIDFGSSTMEIPSALGLGRVFLK